MSIEFFEIILLITESFDEAFVSTASPAAAAPAAAAPAAAAAAAFQTSRGPGGGRQESSEVDYADGRRIQHSDRSVCDGGGRERVRNVEVWGEGEKEVGSESQIGCRSTKLLEEVDDKVKI